MSELLLGVVLLSAKITSFKGLGYPVIRMTGVADNVTILEQPAILLNQNPCVAVCIAAQWIW